MKKKDEKSRFISWVKKHRFELILAGISVTALLTGIICYRDSISELWKKLRKTIEGNNDSVRNDVHCLSNTLQTTVQQIATPQKSITDCSQGLTGIRLTPTKLGNEVLMSAQVINRLLVEKGFQVKLPSCGYQLTEAGKQLGAETIKTTKYNHTFTNIEWDKKVLDYLFTTYEREKIEKYKNRISELFSNTITIKGEKNELS